MPELDFPSGYEHYLEWFWDLSGMTDRAGDGFCKPITSGDYMFWQQLSGVTLSEQDFRILRTMDAAYTGQMNEEIKEDREATANAAKEKVNGG